MPTYGSVNAPYPEQPYYSRTKEVHWKSITFGVLTVTTLAAGRTQGGRLYYSNASTHELYEGYAPTNTAALGPYGEGDAIPRSADTWKDRAIAGVEFTDSGFVEFLGGSDGDVLGAFRYVYLIDFAQLSKDQANPDLPFHDPAFHATELIIEQGWSNLAIPALEQDFAYDNKYQLQLYANADHFIAGPNQTVTVATIANPDGAPIPVIRPSYDTTRLIAWNHGSNVSHYVAYLDHTGWTGVPLPPALVLLSEAFG